MSKDDEGLSLTAKQQIVLNAYHLLPPQERVFWNSAIAKRTGMSKDSVRSAFRLILAKGLVDHSGAGLKAAAADLRTTEEAGFTVAPYPDGRPSLEELLRQRKAEFERKHLRAEATRLIPVQIHHHGPIAIVHMGDPHVDDSGCDIAAIERDINIINRTPGMLGANVGDLNNNWVGRLAQLYGNQETTSEEAWRLVEWIVRSTPWLYLIAGNHGCWSGAGDPLQWMVSHAGVFAKWGARLNLIFPNGKEVRVNARHDFKGTSQYNPNHGPMKATLLGWRDHILTCGHLHTSGHSVLKCPATGLISHQLRVAGYKQHDDFADQLGLPNGNISPAFTTIIDPRFADNDPRLITTIYDTETASDFLTFLRNRK